MKLFTGKQNVTINITTETILRAIALVIVALVVMRFVGAIGHQLRLIGVSIFLAIALNPIVSWLTRLTHRKSRVGATAIAYVLVIVVMGGLMSLIIPPLANQTADFIEDLPATIANFQSQDTALTRALERYNIDDQLRSIGDDLSSNLTNVSRPVINTAARAGGWLVSIVTVLVLTFMFLTEGPAWLNRLWQLQSEDVREHRKKLAYQMYRVVTGYVNGQVLIAAIGASFAGIALFIGSSITDVTVNAVALAGIIFIFGLIPLIGNTLGAVLVVVITLFSSTALAIGIGIYFLIYQQIENATLQPYIQSRNNQLTPLIVFIAALVGAGFGGLLGALAAIPIAGCIRIVVDDYLSKHLPTQTSIKEEKTSA